MVSDDLDVLGLLRKYEHMDKLKKQAADEIERLRQLVAHQSILLDTYRDSLKAVTDGV